MQKKKFKAYLLDRNSIQSYEKRPKFSTEKLDAEDRQYSPKIFGISYSVHCINIGMMFCTSLVTKTLSILILNWQSLAFSDQQYCRGLFTNGQAQSEVDDEGLLF